MTTKIMLLFGLMTIIFSLNVIQSELYESKPGELSETASNVQEYLVSLDDLDSSSIKNNIIKRDILSVDEQKGSADESMRAQSEQSRYLPSHFSSSKRLPQPGVQRRGGRKGIGRKNGKVKRVGRGGRGVQPSIRGRFPRRRGRSRGRSFGKRRGGRRNSRGRSRRRQNQSPAGETVLEEEAEEDVAEEESVPYPIYYDDYYDYDC